MRHTEYKHNIVWVAWTSLLNFVAKHSLYRRGKQKAHQWRKTTNEWGKTSWKKTIAVKTTGTNKTKCSLCAMKLKKNKRPYWTYWFLVWHQTHLPEDRWPATGTGSGLCGWLWMTSVSGSPRSRYQSVTQWTCRLWTATKTSSALNNQVHLPNAFLWKNVQLPIWQQSSSELTNSLHGVSLLDQELGSGDVNVHAERLLLFVYWLCWTRVFTSEHET